MLTRWITLTILSVLGELNASDRDLLLFLPGPNELFIQGFSFYDSCIYTISLVQTVSTLMQAPQNDGIGTWLGE
jgi:hypothetical protein